MWRISKDDFEGLFRLGDLVLVKFNIHMQEKVPDRPRFYSLNAVFTGFRNYLNNVFRSCQKTARLKMIFNNFSAKLSLEKIS
jgi:hypothetical protein